MEIEFENYRRAGIKPVKDFVEEHISDSRGCDGELECFKYEIRELQRALATLCGIMAEKNMLQASEIADIAQGYQGRLQQFVTR